MRTPVWQWNPHDEPRLFDYEVVVSNVGTVYSGRSQDKAHKTFREYVNISQNGGGRAGGESVALLKDGEIVSEHQGEGVET